MKFRIEVQSYLDLEIEAEDAEDARLKVIDNLKNYSEDLVNSCIVHKAEEIN